MSEYRYQFRKYKSPSDRITCPSCGQKRTFTPYVDMQTGELLPDEYGRCERVNNCGYALDPYKDGYVKMLWQQEQDQQVTKPIYHPSRPIPLPKTTPVFIPDEVKDATRKAFGQNDFVKYLLTVFDSTDVESVLNRYQVGTSSRWQGSIVFWYIDIQHRVRAGQIKHFDQTGHTIKDLLSDGEKKSRTTWVHSVLERKTPLPIWLSEYLKQENKVSCLFGEHLLNRESSKTVCVVEAPKTAIIASVYLPQFVWLAVGALNYLTADRCKALEGRNVILWPDLRALEEWQRRADKLSGGRWKVSDFLEKSATDRERKEGLDLADYLVRYHYKDFRLGYPHQWDEASPIGYVLTWVEYTPESLGLVEVSTSPLTEQDLINL